MDIDSVPDRILAYSVAEEYELDFIFVPSFSLVRETGWKGTRHSGMEVGSRANSRPRFDSISAKQFNSMTPGDLKSMCEYWRMVGLFGHG